jgi:hypothetical protein
MNVRKALDRNGEELPSKKLIGKNQKNMFWACYTTRKIIPGMMH